MVSCSAYITGGFETKTDSLVVPLNLGLSTIALLVQEDGGLLLKRLFVLLFVELIIGELIWFW